MRDISNHPTMRLFRSAKFNFVLNAGTPRLVHDPRNDWFVNRPQRVSRITTGGMGGALQMFAPAEYAQKFKCRIGVKI